ncbi:MAG: aldo/keto reductase [Anaerosomatales bacterium]|nr:aldo/keto reductase [Anaerosomatales bacterium]MDT8434190.1 aldo/keto reductase [Anaerosomatales bacterium]
MMLEISSTVRLANGGGMPVLGFGTYKIVSPDEVERSVLTAFEAGYRGIDTASVYGNEEAIGRALSACGIPRDELFITSKVWNDEQGEEGVLRAIEGSLKRLGVDRVDLYLVHWPIPRLYESTWRGMERVLETGLARAIGVCNFLGPHLEELAARTGAVPMVDQVEHHPWLQQPDLRRYCHDRGIVVQGWGPVMRGRADEEPLLAEIAAAHGVSSAQVALRWALQHGVVVIPKSVTPERIRQNADLFGFELSPDEMATIDALDRGEAGRLGQHPDRTSF